MLYLINKLALLLLQVEKYFNYFVIIIIVLNFI